MDIKSFFELKKRELSNKSEEGDDAKRARDSSLDRSTAEAEKECDVFAEGLKSEDCVVILYHCMQNLEKMKEMCAMTEASQANQITGTQEFVEMNKSISHINEIFEEYQKDKKEEEKINNLEKNFLKCLAKLKISKNQSMIKNSILAETVY